MGWFKKHKILTLILVLVVLSLIGAAAGGGSSQQGAQPASPTPNTAPAEQAAQPPAQTKSAFDGVAFYDKVQNGMAKAEVIAAAGKAADNCSESQMEGLGKYENCTWYEGSFSSKFVTVSFNDDKVSTKSKYGY